MIYFAKIGAVLKNITFKIARILGILLVIYISMVFYLALTERRNAFPRAIYHKEANAAIANKTLPITCSLNDGVVLNGFFMGKKNAQTLLYYPDENEDVAQFFSQLDSLPNACAIAFNYRGSAQNKGTPSQETFETDAMQIAQCALQFNEQKNLTVVGHGTGAILAAKQQDFAKKLIFIDPVFDIAEAISQKYRYLYPKFLVRSKLNANMNALNKIQNKITIIFNQKQNEQRTQKETFSLKSAARITSYNSTLNKIIKKVIAQ